MSREQIVHLSPTGAPTEVMSEAHARDVVDRIRQTTGRLLEAMADVEQLITTAYQGRAWVALGYASWDELCTAEFTEARMWASVEERQQRTRTLADAGMSTRAIAAVLAVSRETARKDVLATDNKLSVANPVTSDDAGLGASGGAVAGPVAVVRDHTGSGGSKSVGLDGRERSRQRVTSTLR